MEVFRYRIPLQPSDHSRVWKSARFGFDTSALLDIYGLAKEDREELLKVFDNLSSQLFLPYQVGKEFFDNRPNADIFPPPRHIRTIYAGIKCDRTALVTNGGTLAPKNRVCLRFKGRDSAEWLTRLQIGPLSAVWGYGGRLR